MPLIPELWTLNVSTPADPDYMEMAGNWTLNVISVTLWKSNKFNAPPYWELRKSGGNYVLVAHTLAGATANFNLSVASFNLSGPNVMTLASSTAGWTTPTTLTVTPGSLYLELLHSPADILRQLLVNIGAGSLPTSEAAWPITTDQELPEPDDVITIYDTLGRIDGQSMPEGEIDEHYGIQIRLRSGLHTDGYRKLFAIRRYLSRSVTDVTVTLDGNSYRVWSIPNLGSINRLGKDAPNSRRRLFTLNGTMVVTPVP